MIALVVLLLGVLLAESYFLGKERFTRGNEYVARAEFVVEPVGTLWIDEFPVPIKRIYLDAGKVQFEADVTETWDALPAGGVWRVADPSGNMVLIARQPFDKRRWQDDVRAAQWSGGSVTLSFAMEVNGSRPGEEWATSSDDPGPIDTVDWRGRKR